MDLKVPIKKPSQSSSSGGENAAPGYSSDDDDNAGQLGNTNLILRSQIYREYFGDWGPIFFSYSLQNFCVLNAFL